MRYVPFAVLLILFGCQPAAPPAQSQIDALRQDNQALKERVSKLEARLLDAEKALISEQQERENVARHVALLESAGQAVPARPAIQASIAAPAPQPLPTPSPRVPEFAARQPKPSGPPTSDTGIIAQCSQKWGTNYEMVEYCEKEQQEAKDTLEKRERDHPINDSVMVGIRRDCEAKWRGNYEMRDYCEKEQITAYQRINTHR